MNNISFQGKTNLLFDSKIYDTLTTRQVRKSSTNLNISPGKDYKIHRARFSTLNPNEVNDISVLLLNEKGGMFFHCAENKIANIIDLIEKLKETAKGKLTAWIIGGHSGEQTTRKVNSLAEVLCDRPDIDTSIIAGQKSVAPNITLYPTAEKLDVTVGLKNPKNADIDLENYFDIVELNNTSIA